MSPPSRCGPGFSLFRAETTRGCDAVKNSWVSRDLRARVAMPPRRDRDWDDSGEGRGVGWGASADDGVDLVVTTADNDDAVDDADADADVSARGCRDKYELAWRSARRWMLGLYTGSRSASDSGGWIVIAGPVTLIGTGAVILGVGDAFGFFLCKRNFDEMDEAREDDEPKTPLFCCF